ncbi:MAG TPA: type II secretion system F family protein [Lapillicoccus sp.]
MIAVVVALLIGVGAALLWPRSRLGPFGADRAARRPAAGRPSPVDQGRLWLSSRRRRAEAERAAVEAVEMLDALAPALRAGLPPVAALRLVTPTSPHGRRALRELDDAAARGEPLGPAWSAHAETVDSDDLRFVAAAWTLCDTLGSPIAPMVSMISEMVRRRRAVRQRIASALAGPQATMHVLTALPLTGPLLALAVGVSPADLYAQPSAAVALATGLVLLAIGRAWTSRMVRAVSAEPHGPRDPTRGGRLFGRKSGRSSREPA